MMGPYYTSFSKERTEKHNLRVKMYAPQDAEAEKVETKIIISGKNCVVRFTKIVTDSNTISSTFTHFPSLVPEGFTNCIPRNFYNNF